VVLAACECCKPLAPANVLAAARFNALWLAAWGSWYGPIWLGPTDTCVASKNRELAAPSLGAPVGTALTLAWFVVRNIPFCTFNALNVVTIGEVKPPSHHKRETSAARLILGRW